MFSLIPKEVRFYDYFEQQSRHILKAATLLHDLVHNFSDARAKVHAIKEVEHEGDHVTHEIVKKLNTTFVTPIDREDIFALASGMDDIVDYIEEVADFLGLYRIEAPMEQAQRLARILHEASRSIAQAIPRLRTFNDIHHFTVEINRLENDGDRILREALASLFERGIDPMMVIRWKDIFERLEDAIDATEKTANILEGIVIKNT